MRGHENENALKRKIWSVRWDRLSVRAQTPKKESWRGRLVKSQPRGVTNRKTRGGQEGYIINWSLLASRRLWTSGDAQVRSAMDLVVAD